MRRLVAAVALPFVAAVMPPAAAAEPPRVILDRTVRAQPFGTGWIIVVRCHAQADPGDPVAEHAVATGVVCSIGDQVRREAAPGGNAYAVVASAVTGPTAVCISGEADFADVVNGRLVTATAAPDCVTYGG